MISSPAPFSSAAATRTSTEEDDMAGVDVGPQGGHKRATNSDINMVPFIDLLFVTVAFLLITAVWVTNSRINADAQVPGKDSCGEDCSHTPEKVLHVSIGENDFNLAWKQAGTVLSETHVAKDHVAGSDEGTATVRYPDLAKAIEKEWGAHGGHVDPSDRKPDQVILHTDNKTPFKELVAVLDAVNGTKRDLRTSDGKTMKMPAFNSTFAVR
jgi:biopolymer transport protein ExbD